MIVFLSKTPVYFLMQICIQDIYFHIWKYRKIACNKELVSKKIFLLLHFEYVQNIGLMDEMNCSFLLI